MPKKVFCFSNLQNSVSFISCYRFLIANFQLLINSFDIEIFSEILESIEIKERDFYILGSASDNFTSFADSFHNLTCSSGTVAYEASPRSLQSKKYFPVTPLTSSEHARKRVV